MRVYVVLAERKALHVATKRENPGAPVAETPGQSMSSDRVLTQIPKQITSCVGGVSLSGDDCKPSSKNN